MPLRWEGSRALREWHVRPTKSDMLVRQTEGHVVMNGATASQEFLLECIRAQVHGNTRIIVEQILKHEKIDWPYVLMQSELHRVSGVLFDSLRNIDGNDLVPIGAMGQLEARYLQTVAKNLTLRSELRNILEALEDHGIDTIVLKGAALAETAYGNIGLREMLDIDILVPPEKAMMAYAAVENLGYSPKEDVQKQDERRLRHEHFSQLFGGWKPCIVEIHTNIVGVDNPLRFDVSGFWDRAVEVDIAGTRAMVLSPIDQLIHLSIHFFKDRHGSSYSALSQLLDMAMVIRRTAGSFDWTLLTYEATSKGITGPVFLGLYLAKMLLLAKVPEDVISSLRPQQFKRKNVDRFIRRRVFGQKAFVKSLFEPRESYNWRSIPSAVLKRILQRENHGIHSNGMRMGSARSVFSDPRHYLNGVVAKVNIARNAISHPIRLFEDMASDRWLHSLYSAESNETENIFNSTAPTEQVARH